MSVAVGYADHDARVDGFDFARGKAEESLARDQGAHACIDTGALEAAGELQAMGGAKVILCTASDATSAKERPCLRFLS